MKTIEQKAEAYDKVREKIALRFGSDAVKEIFSEFEESEDERMRKFVKYAVDYLFNSKKEKYICNTHKDEVVAWLEKQGEQQKPAWSEEDENMVRYIGNAITCEESAKYLEEKGIDMIKAHRWLEFHKSQFKQEWSEEDEYMMDETIQHLKQLIAIDKAKHCARDVQYYQRDIDWLKSLRLQKHWKPSEKQINALIDVLSIRDIKYDVLSELLECLKKLK